MTDLGVFSTSCDKQLKQGAESSALPLKAAATASGAPHVPCRCGCAAGAGRVGRGRVNTVRAVRLLRLAFIDYYLCAAVASDKWE